MKATDRNTRHAAHTSLPPNLRPGPLSRNDAVRLGIRGLVGSESRPNAFQKFNTKEANNDRTRGSAIPKGLCLPAQGCEERATLGGGPQRFQPQRSSFLATLGFEPQSLWDSSPQFVCIPLRLRAFAPLR